MVSQLCLVCGSTHKLSDVSLGTRPRYSLVVEEDVKKLTNRTKDQLSKKKKGQKVVRLYQPRSVWYYQPHVHCPGQNSSFKYIGHNCEVSERVCTAYTQAKNHADMYCNLHTSMQSWQLLYIAHSGGGGGGGGGGR